MRALLNTIMSESDIERQKRSRVRGGGAEGRRDATNDATPDIQTPGMINEVGKEQDGKQKQKKRASSRGDRSRQH
jgi:hypothetical protein